MEELYCIDKKGKIRVFKGEIVEDINNFLPSIVTSTGIYGGNLSTKVTKISKGKQGRSPAEQAKFQLQSEYNSKYDEGYKSKQMLLDRINYLNQEKQKPKIDDGTIDILFELASINYNTAKDWSFLPMLAAKWKDRNKKVKYPVFVQPKLNGVRCIVCWNKDKQEVEMLSRGGKKYNLDHIKEPFIEFYKHGDVNAVFDGELYKHGVPLQKISGDVRREDQSKSGYIEYHIYDTCFYNTDQFVRFQKLNLYFSRIPILGSNDPIKKVVTKQAENAEKVKNYHDLWVSEGYEGCIVRSYSGEYEFGFRSDDLIKVKEFIDEEFEIIGCEVDPDKGIESFVFILDNNQGKMVTRAAIKDRNTFKARPTGTLEEKEEWYKNINNFIGKKATVRYQERTVDGLPHQAHVRHKDTPILIEAIRDYE